MYSSIIAAIDDIPRPLLVYTATYLYLDGSCILLSLAQLSDFPDHLPRMVYKLYGHPFSTCTNRVLIVAKEVGVDVEFHHIDLFKGEHKQPEFLKKQPFGQVPYFEDTEEGLTFYEYVRSPRLESRHVTDSFHCSFPPRTSYL